MNDRKMNYNFFYKLNVKIKIGVGNQVVIQFANTGNKSHLKMKEKHSRILRKSKKV